MIVATFARTSVSNNFVRLTVFNIMTLSSDLTSLQSRHTLVCALSQFDTAQHVQLQLLDVLHNKHLPVLMPVPQSCMHAADSENSILCITEHAQKRVTNEQ